MAIKAFAEKNCSVAQPLAFLGERWALLVLRDVSIGRRRFDEIQDSLGVASNVLAQRLGSLVEEGILERRRYSEHPDRFEYVETQKGRDLLPILLAFLRWGDTYTAGPSGPPLETVHTECGHAFRMVPTCSHCGGEVSRDNVRARVGPGATEEQRRDLERLLARGEERRLRAEETRLA